MTVAEGLAAAAVAVLAATGMHGAWAARSESVRAAADLDEALVVAGGYRRANCAALPTAATALATLASALGRTLSVEHPGEWQVVYRAGPAGTGSRRGGATMDLVLTSASAARRRAVADRGGLESAGVVTLTVAASGWREHRGRRAFAHLQGSAPC